MPTLIQSACEALTRTVHTAAVDGGVNVDSELPDFTFINAGAYLSVEAEVRAFRDSESTEKMEKVVRNVNSFMADDMKHSGSTASKGTNKENCGGQEEERLAFSTA
uniref:Uncharacterized protein n=1 Tax=Parascaris equorum TaxID=6256 RepID=A0A914R8A3_PAREQ